MRKRERQRRRRALWGWIKWTPALFLVFSILFSDVLLNIETRRNDYSYHELNAAIRELRGEIKDLKNDRAGLEDLDDLALAAPDLGLQEPSPEQIETIVFRATPLPLMDTGFAVAESPATMRERALEERIATLVGDVAEIQDRSHDLVRWLHDQFLNRDEDTVEPSLIDDSEAEPSQTAEAFVEAADPNVMPDESLPDLLGHL